jgi:hypothetical protein
MITTERTNINVIIVKRKKRKKNIIAVKRTNTNVISVKRKKKKKKYDSR